MIALAAWVESPTTCLRQRQCAQPELSMEGGASSALEPGTRPSLSRAFWEYGEPLSTLQSSLFFGSHHLDSVAGFSWAG